MNRRGFIRRLLGLVTAPFAIVIALRKPKTMHLRFDRSEQRVVTHGNDVYVMSAPNGYIDHPMDDGRIDFNAENHFQGGWQTKPYSNPFVLLKRE